MIRPTAAHRQQIAAARSQHETDDDDDASAPLRCGDGGDGKVVIDVFFVVLLARSCMEKSEWSVAAATATAKGKKEGVGRPPSPSPRLAHSLLRAHSG